MEKIKTFDDMSNPVHYQFESVQCYQCSSDRNDETFIYAQEDLTGKPGVFRFVKCPDCGLVYQNPRIDVSQIKDFYDDEYIAHRKKADWGILTKFYEKAMEKHDREKFKIVKRVMNLTREHRVLDVGCAVGTFLEYIKRQSQCQVTGVDFKDLRQQNQEKGIQFHQGLFYEQPFLSNTLDLITMWHFLEHDYDPRRSLEMARKILKQGGYLIIEVPRLDSTSFRLFKERWPGLQAPQHTVLFDKAHFCQFIRDSGFEIVEYLPWGAFPAYFYLFAGLVFKLNNGRGINLNKIIYPYYLGQLLASPLLMFEKKSNLAMQTIICKKKE